MADDYSRLRNIHKRLTELPQEEEEAVAAVRARYKVKMDKLKESRRLLVTAVKGDEEQAGQVSE